MSDKLNSINNYTVNNISSINTATNITRRPYNDNTTSTPNKKKKKKDTFKDTLKSSNSHNSSENDSDAFSDLLSTELNDAQKLRSNEQYRIIRANFQNKSANRGNNLSETDDNAALHAKLNEAMKVEVDASALCKKIELLNSLRKDSNK